MVRIAERNGTYLPEFTLGETIIMGIVTSDSFKSRNPEEQKKIVKYVFPGLEKTANEIEDAISNLGSYCRRL